jgi:L-histidine Nalpha-methyltransferase
METRQQTDDSPPSRSLSEICLGLQAQPKRLPCRLFYDERGSRLFEDICRTSEYYLTRAELEILHRHAPEMAELLPGKSTLVEFGSGASLKTRALLNTLDAHIYVPIDISAQILQTSSEQLARDYPELQVRPLAKDFLEPLALPLAEAERKEVLLFFFPGSTLGNLEPLDAIAFLLRTRQSFRGPLWFLIGVDLPKGRAVLEAAYNDEAGITARFNRNVLHVLNRKYGANFSPEAFAHRAIWNSSAQRVEMHLVSCGSQYAKVAGTEILLDDQEFIVTEHCYKYSIANFRLLARRAGFEVVKVWLDSAEQFSIHLLRST